MIEERRPAPYWPALDGVRALAVTAVLLFHGGVAWLHGGFLGVDAFFVLSGFLITSLLLAERDRTGRIRLGSFWLRRARRLLPALLVVLVVVVLAFRDLLPRLELSMLRGDAYSALVYAANWRMIYRGDDYFGRTSAPSPLQHTWSLGIEEQFYLLWPLIVVAVLALGLRLGRRVLLVVCLAGAVASELAAAALFHRTDINRAYFGTDTRAQALLIGCAMAVVLATGVRLPRRSLTVAAWVGVAVVGTLWVTANGSDTWLYRGGLTLGAVAVALVLAQAVTRPDSALAGALAIAPLVWLGRISYGVYLWHWPLYALLTAERTHLTGAALLVLRIAVTLAVAVVSYVLIEKPVRTGVPPFRMPALPRLGRLALPVGATAAVAATASVILVGTMSPQVVSAAAPQIVVPTAAPKATTGSEPSRSPMQRPGRKPGEAPRIEFFGDSVSWTIATYIQDFPGLSVTNATMPGCGIARLPDIIYIDEPHTNYPECPTWDHFWQGNLDIVDPDVAVLLLDRWELMDRKLGDEYMHVGEPLFDMYLRAELEYGLSILSSHGAHVVLLTAPYTHRWEKPDGGLYPEDMPERVDAWNRLLRSVADEHGQTMTVLDLNRRACPDGKFTWNIGSLQLRSDGLHFTPEGVQQWIAPWLMPQLAQIAVYGPLTRPRGD
jgi:peptidoglycan/LPS O-acetylase OafA/YrhL